MATHRGGVIFARRLPCELVAAAGIEGIVPVASSEPRVDFVLNDAPAAAAAGVSVAVAVMVQGVNGFRRSVTGEPRGPLCGMGVCFECRLTIDGRPHQKSCQIPLTAGMVVRTDG